MNQKDIKSSAQNHLTAKCSEHHLSIVEICPVENCKNIFICRMCKREHPNDHLSQTYYLKEIFEDSTGIFNRLSEINALNVSMVQWLENELGFQFDEIRVQIDKILNQIQENILKQLKSKLPLIPNSLELQQYFVKFISAEAGVYSEEARKFISEYHKYSKNFETNSEINLSGFYYPRIIVPGEQRQKLFDIVQETLNDLSNSISFQVIEEPKMKPFRYYKQPQDILIEMKKFKDEFIANQRDEMKKELEKHINIFKEQALDTEKYYSQKLISTNEELVEIKKAWQQNEKIAEDRISQIKLQYEQTIKEMINTFTEKLEERQMLLLLYEQREQNSKNPGNSNN